MTVKEFFKPRKEKYGILLVVVFFLLLVPQTVRADFFTYPLDFMFYNPALMLVLNYLINAGVFALGSFLFIRKTLKSISKKKFIFTILILTVAGLFADYFPATLRIYSLENFFAVTLFLLIIFNFLVARYYLKAPAKGALFVGIFMGILTNPYTYALLWLTFFHPSHTFDYQSIMLLNGYCTGGDTANVLVRNSGALKITLSDVSIIDTSTNIAISPANWTNIKGTQAIIELDPGKTGKFNATCSGYCTYRFIYGGATGVTQSVSVAC